MATRYNNEKNIFSFEDIFYKINPTGSSASVIGRSRIAPSRIAIPDHICVENKCYEVTEIEDRAFCDCNEDNSFSILLEISLPNTLRRIGEHAFSSSRSDMLDMDIPAGCEVDETAFE